MKKLVLIFILIVSIFVTGCGKDKIITQVQKFQFEPTYTVGAMDGSTFDLKTGLDSVAYIAAINEAMYTDDPQATIQSRKLFIKVMENTKKALLDSNKYTWAYMEDMKVVEIVSTEKYNRNFWMHISVGLYDGKVKIHPKGMSFEFFGEFINLSDLKSE